MKITSLRILGNSLFFTGLIFGFALAVISTWNKVETVNYFFRGSTPYPPFNGLRCPIMITRSEQGIIKAHFDNPADEDDNFYYRVEISGRIEPRQIADNIIVAPHDQEVAQWVVSEKDIDLGFFIFMKIVILPNGLHPAQEATCGITVLNFQGLTGKQIFTIALVFSLLGIGFGLGLLQRTILNKGPSSLLLGIVVLLGMLSGLLGWWFLGILFIVLAILLAAIFVRNILA